jgi:hypothetical protein
VTLTAISTTTTAVEETTGAVATSIVSVTIGGVLGSLDGSSIGSSDVGGLGSLGSLDDIEFHLLSISETAKELLRVVVGDGSLVDEDIVIGVTAVDETISLLHIEPLDSSSDSLGQHRLLLSLGLRGFGLVLGHSAP